MSLVSGTGDGAAEWNFRRTRRLVALPAEFGDIHIDPIGVDIVQVLTGATGKVVRVRIGDTDLYTAPLDPSAAAAVVAQILTLTQ